MCRAVWVLVVGSNRDSIQTLRRAAGADVEVVAEATSRDEALAKADELRLDVAIIDGETNDAGALAESLRVAGLAVVMVGGIGADVGKNGELANELPGAITRALMARRPPR
jgi:chemotaxis response regulator CheB